MCNKGDNMGKHNISGVPRHFESYISDCFQNTLAALMLYLNQDPEVILADYLSFMYNTENGYVGLNYLFKPNTTVEFSEEELNTSLEFIYFPVPRHYSDDKTIKEYKDRITVNMYIENDENNAYEHVKQLIDNDMPAIVAVDLFYMPYHKAAFQKIHDLHYVVITGYDEERKCFELFDNYKITNSVYDGELSFDEIRIARNSENPQNNALLGDYKRPLQNIWITADIPEAFKASEEKAINILNESCKRLGGDRVVLGNKCGLEMLEDFKKDLMRKKNDGIDEKTAYMFKTYYYNTFKAIVRSRKRFNVFIKKMEGQLPGKIITDVSNSINNSMKHWEIATNVSIKLSITKSLALVDNMCEQLEKIKDEEYRALECMSSYLNGSIF